jgi:predicted dienelactone hydrolase
MPGAFTAPAPAQNLPDHVSLPAPTGPYAVGREAFDWTDEERVDPFAPEAGTKRSLTGYIWYPAVAASAPRAAYVPREILSALARQANPAAADLARRYTIDQANVTSHALERAPLLPGKQRRPVLLMKPGKGGLVLQYATLAEELASHGYIVAGSDSPYTTPVVMHEDGRIAVRNARGSPSDTAPGQTSELAPGQPNDLSVPVVNTWAADNAFILDRLTTLDRDRSSRFHQRLDLRAVGAFGHSMGGAAAMQFCKDDVRCRASVNMDGALWGDVAVDGLRTPALFIFSDRPLLDRGNPDNAGHPLIAAIDRIRANLPNRNNLVVVRGSRHYNFADSSLLNDSDFARGIDMLGPIDPARGIALTRTLVRGFFDRHLRNSPVAFPPASDPALRIER